MNQWCLVLLALLAIDQLDKGDKLQRKLTWYVLGIYRVVGGVEILLYFPRS